MTDFLKYLPTTSGARRTLNNPSKALKIIIIICWYMFSFLVGILLSYAAEKCCVSIALFAIPPIIWTAILLGAFADNEGDVINKWEAAYRARAINYFQTRETQTDQEDSEKNIKDRIKIEFGKDFSERRFKLFGKEIIKDYFFYASKGLWPFSDLFKQKKIDPDTGGLTPPWETQ